VAAVGGIQTAHATLTTTTADTVTLTGQGVSLAVTNHDATEKLWFRIDGSTAVALADENFIVLPGTTKVLGVTTTAASAIVSVVGNGNVYSVEIL
jgi:hypothetical protein